MVLAGSDPSRANLFPNPAKGQQRRSSSQSGGKVECSHVVLRTGGMKYHTFVWEFSACHQSCHLSKSVVVDPSIFVHPWKEACRDVSWFVDSCAAGGSVRVHARRGRKHANRAHARQGVVWTRQANRNASTSREAACNSARVAGVFISESFCPTWTGTHGTVPHLNFVLGVVCTIVGVRNQKASALVTDANTRNSAGAQPQDRRALLCELHSGRSLPDTQVSRRNRHLHVCSCVLGHRTRAGRLRVRGRGRLAPTERPFPSVAEGVVV